jgi:hypothetical protein
MAIGGDDLIPMLEKMGEYWGEKEKSAKVEHQEWNKWHVFSAEEKCLPRNDRDIESNWGLTKHLWYDKVCLLHFCFHLCHTRPNFVISTLWFWYDQVNLTESNAPHILGEDATKLGEEEQSLTCPFSSPTLPHSALHLPQLPETYPSYSNPNPHTTPIS